MPRAGRCGGLLFLGKIQLQWRIFGEYCHIPMENITHLLRGMCTAQVSGTGFGRDTGGTLDTSMPCICPHQQPHTVDSREVFLFSKCPECGWRGSDQTSVHSPPSSFQRSRARGSSRSSPTTMGCWSCTGDFVSHSPTGSSSKNWCNHFLSHYNSWAPFGQ